MASNVSRHVHFLYGWLNALGRRSNYPRRHGGADAWGRASSGVCDFVCLCVCVCLCARTLKWKWLELSTPILVHTYSTAVAQHSLNRRSKGQRSRSHRYENRHGRMAAIVKCAAAAVCYCCQRGTARRTTA